MSNCPKCGKKLSPFYFKQDCPSCGVNLLYYNMEERLQADAKEAQRQAQKAAAFKEMLIQSSVASPLHIFRLILFFLPLASMCLPMFTADGQTVSLVSMIVGIIKNDLDIEAIASNVPYLIGALSMMLVIVLSLAQIIASLFSAAKGGLKRNIAFGAVNTLVFVAMSVAVCVTGGKIGIGCILTAVIYVVYNTLNFAVDKKIKRRKENTQ